MPGRQAKVISSTTLRCMLAYARNSPHPVRNRTIILLSVKAGLRAAEIAKLEWPMVLDARGRIADTMCVQDAIAKKRAGRRVPLHPELRKALVKLRTEAAGEGPIIVSARGGRMQANSIVNWFVTMFRELGVEGCSSHSGRRTFITTAARNVHRVGCSLRDVQLLAGHSSIETTQRYIDGDTNGQRRLVSLL
jgi:integrase/recombinase XerD